MSWDTTLEYYLGFGLASARPASGNPAPNAFEFYYAYDTPALYVWNSNTSAWDTAGGGGTGTVTSVGLSLPADFTVSGSPVTTSGTLSAVWANESANVFLAGPASGSAAAPTWRALAAGDFPATTIPVGSINATGTPSSSNFLRGDGTWSPASGGGGGTVTSVGLAQTGTGATLYTITGSPVTSSGTIDLALNTQSPNQVFAGPSGGSAATPDFRPLAPADLPASGVTAGTYGDATTGVMLTISTEGTVTAAVTHPIAPAAVINTAQTSSYTFIISDANDCTPFNSSSATNATIPPNSSVAFPVGTTLYIEQSGSGAVTFVAGAGVTINTPFGAATAGVGAWRAAVQMSTNVWDIL